MSKRRINQWLIEIKKYLFTYRDGFFDLPYLSNTPAVMVESLMRMPFTKHDPAKRTIHANNIFTDGLMHYRELEEGLWILITEIEFKKNVSTNALYDEEPCDYHFLSHFIYTSPVEGIAVNDITIPTVGWSLYKPGTEIKTYFNKGDKGVFANFVFNDAWFERNMPVTAFGEDHDFRRFLESDVAYMTWENVLPDSELLLKEILNTMALEKEGQSGVMALKILCLQFIFKFFTNIAASNMIKVQTKLSDGDRLLVVRTEKILTDHLTSSFPGIEEMALTLHTSSTKLKTTFKAVHENSIFQYYQQKQMLLALQILKTNPTSLKNIALTFGYSNPSKFSAAFKKYHNFLPSEA